MSRTGADFIFACGILYVSHVAGHGHQALAGSLFNMSTRAFPPPRPSLRFCVLTPQSPRTEIGTAIGLAINSIVQDKVTARATENLGMVYDPNAVSRPSHSLSLSCELPAEHNLCWRDSATRRSKRFTRASRPRSTRARDSPSSRRSSARRVCTASGRLDIGRRRTCQVLARQRRRYRLFVGTSRIRLWFIGSCIFRRL